MNRVDQVDLAVIHFIEDVLYSFLLDMTRWNQVAVIHAIDCKMICEHADPTSRDRAPVCSVAL